MRVAYSQPHLCCVYVGENRSDIAMGFIIRHCEEVGADLRPLTVFLNHQQVLVYCQR